MSKSLNLIALVATAMVVGGERVVFEPGETLPDVSAKEAKELIDTKVARAPVDETRAASAGNSPDKDSPDPDDASPGQAVTSEPDASKPRTPAKKSTTPKP